RGELGRQTGERGVEQPAEAGDRVVHGDVDAAARVRRPRECAVVGGGIVTPADMRLERGARARAPHDANVPDQAARLVGDAAGHAVVGDEAAIAAHDRNAVRIAHRIAARYLDILVPDAADEREVAGYRHLHVGPHEAILHALV